MEPTSDPEIETEIMTAIIATIIPSKSRDDGSKDRLLAFIRQLDNLQELPVVIKSG